MADLVPDQIQGSGPPGAAFLVDAWGRPFSVQPNMFVGRRNETFGLRIFHPSVSGVHLELLRPPNWEVRDCGSTNGTTLNGMRILTSQIVHGDVLGVGGGAKFRFATDHLERIGSLSIEVRRTEVARGSLLRRFALLPFRHAESGGVLSVGAVALELPALEFAFAGRLADAASDPEPERSYLPSFGFADLPWNSRTFDAGQLRVLVKRLRERLKDKGIRDFVESKRGRGYRINPQYRQASAPS